MIYAYFWPRHSLFSIILLTAVVVIFNVFITELMAQRDYAGVTAMEETVIHAVEEQFHNTKIKDRHMVRFRDFYCTNYYTWDRFLLTKN